MIVKQAGERNQQSITMQELDHFVSVIHYFFHHYLSFLNALLIAVWLIMFYFSNHFDIKMGKFMKSFILRITHVFQGLECPCDEMYIQSCTSTKTTCTPFESDVVIVVIWCSAVEHSYWVFIWKVTYLFMKQWDEPHLSIWLHNDTICNLFTACLKQYTKRFTYGKEKIQIKLFGQYSQVYSMMVFSITNEWFHGIYTYIAICSKCDALFVYIQLYVPISMDTD